LTAPNFWTKCPKKSGPASQIAIVRLSDKISIFLVFRSDGYAFFGDNIHEGSAYRPPYSDKMSAEVCSRDKLLRFAAPVRQYKGRANLHPL
jgi:hypothetical protein